MMNTNTTTNAIDSMHLRNALTRLNGQAFDLHPQALKLWSQSGGAVHPEIQAMSNLIETQPVRMEQTRRVGREIDLTNALKRKGTK